MVIVVTKKRIQMIRGSAVGIATGCWLDDQGVWVRVPVGIDNFPHAVQAGSEEHPAAYSMGSGDCSCEGKVAGASS
jgi:hypothetical protein